MIFNHLSIILAWLTCPNTPWNFLPSPGCQRPLPAFQDFGRPNLSTPWICSCEVARLDLPAMRHTQPTYSGNFQHNLHAMLFTCSWNSIWGDLKPFIPRQIGGQNLSNRSLKPGIWDIGSNGSKIPKTAFGKPGDLASRTWHHQASRYWSFLVLLVHATWSF